MDNQKVYDDYQRVLDVNDSYSQSDFDGEHPDLLEIKVNKDQYKIGVSFANKSDNPDPEYATNGSSGFDLRANLEEALIIPAGGRFMVPTGLFFNIPDNFEIQVRPRSGLAAKHGVTVLNTPGTVDADYRGEVKVILINHGPDFTIKHGDRIAQAVVATVMSKSIINLNKVDDIDTDTERGAGGFGSTGTK